MATQLFLTSAVADTHLGTDTLKDGANGSGGVGASYTSRALSTSRGSGVTASFATPTATFATDNTQPIMASSGTFLEWISPPVAADVTISGTITFNVWASESNMSANMNTFAYIDVIRANATATRNSNTLVKLANAIGSATEIAVTTRAVQNSTGSAIGVTVNRGDRIRVVLGGASVTSAAAFTWNVGYAGTSAAADGDTYVTFTENFSFESAPGVLERSNATPAARDFGRLTTYQRYAQSFVATGDLSQVKVWLAKFGSPTDDVVLEIQSDSSGSPSGSTVSTVATVNNASLGASAEYTYGSLSITLTAGSTYWLVCRRSGSLDDANRYQVSASAPLAGGLAGAKAYDGSSWSTPSATAPLAVSLTMSTSVLYLTDTASDVATASVDKEAWTTNGSSTTLAFGLPVAGWAAPVQFTDTAGGTVLDWFTKQLQAFTLGGLAVASVPVQNTNAASNTTIRCEIARVDSDGTSPTVWASWCMAPTGTDNGEVPAASTVRTVNVSGDDLSVSDGQRLRIRFYVDDTSSAAMTATGISTGLRYNSASFISSITLPQTVTEFVVATDMASYTVGPMIGY